MSAFRHVRRATRKTRREKPVKRIFKGPWIWIVVAVVGVLLALQYLAPNGGYDEVTTDEMNAYIANGQIDEITFIDGDQEIKATLDDDVDRSGGNKISTHWIIGQQIGMIDAVDAQIAKGTISKETSENPQPSVLGSLLVTFLPILLIVGLFLFLMNNVQGGGGRGVMQFGKSKAKLISKDMPKTTFADVAGCNEAIEELGEIKEFLQEPAKFQAVGAKIPKGVLLYGPPGTGKTLLARAVAGEAGVPFYSISGSDFVEMFVGVGASRVRDLFEQAKENAPAIVFIDEIDAVGRHRGAGMGGGHDEREQTLNQLLVEMDGFDVRGGVILIAATNRPDVLDPALLRPGRFDRQIGVDAPDLAGRHMILNVHSRGKPMSPDIDLKSIARRTPGFTGADLANVLNEAALLTARNNEKLITDHALDEAIDRVIAGPQRSSRLMSEKEKLITAYHEGGHALVAAALPGTDPVHKITILPRGRALGYTMVLPDEDKYSQTRSEMLDKLAYMLGGRAAEEMVFHDPTTGAGNDIEKATSLARAMVTQYGMTESLGAIKLGDSNSEPFLGRDMGHQRNYSEDVAAKIDEETKKFLATAHQEAFDILEENRDVLDALVLALLDRETLDKAEVAEVFEPLRRRSSRPAWTGSPDRNPSTIPPIEIPQEIRDRVAANGAAPQEDEAAVIITPPGSGGDVHGDPGVGTRDPGTDPRA
ncbi:ATP-dependent zinc metalloprotease FtsH [Nocardioides sp. KIGAM211]|uniref:ATP-dependent zinc metalloprotease FtsH n=1 Tax=Nocardioides luti TaxID=2761101 RepID=A0A7X0VAK7_9ACTN|nr:ATP-dependent zinc metalloprotease FtsH [Nocardioides luti]MBB6627450.1 ATP-dependent zinc metalloprotease FtsH [Nocardioides luti]